MQKRRERIERWRAERKKKELDSVKKDVRTTIMCKYKLQFYLFILLLFSKHFHSYDNFLSTFYGTIVLFYKIVI